MLVGGRGVVLGVEGGGEAIHEEEGGRRGIESRLYNVSIPPQPLI